MTEAQSTEIIRFHPTAEQRTQLLAIRARMIAEYEQHWHGQFRADLYELEDGSWLDVWWWASKELAETALSSDDLTPTFSEWKNITGPVDFSWATKIEVAGEA